MKKKYVLLILVIGLALSLIYARYNYRMILYYITPDITLNADEVKLPVLVYHHFSEEKKNQSALVVGRENFRRQIKYLKDNGYHAISIRELVDFVEKEVPLPEKPVLITIDDGYESNYTIAFEVLKEFNTKATIFMIGHAVGSTSYKETGAPLDPYITLEQGREMIASGLVSIQSHSMDMHQIADYEKYLNNDKIRISATKKDFDTDDSYLEYFNQDTARSKQQITQDFGEDWLAYSYPLGHYDDLTEELLSQSGIKVTMSVDKGMNVIQMKNPKTLRTLKRFLVSDKTSDQTLSYMLRAAGRRKND
ncbi:hypothetical protein EII17_09130 [Clostridiales bacterium COT073_COT-073]|nr:hypothetical protein EII17_09130 [Clostridiales bacterium COT073_COT-073]